MRNQSDCVLIQQASGLYKELLAMTVTRHLHYCEAFDMDYWPIFGETRRESLGTIPHYDRVSLLRTALEAGYERAIWLDADAVILRGEDLREAVPEEGIGALWCAREGGWDDPELYDHWCTGLLYVHSDISARTFLSVWEGTSDYGHGWADQHAFNNMAKTMHRDTIHPISRKWHGILPEFPPEDDSTPVVVAFHGYGDFDTRREVMQMVLAGGEA